MCNYFRVAAKWVFTHTITALLLTPLVIFIWSCESDTEAGPPPVPPPSLTDWTQQQSFTFVPLTDIHFVDKSFGWAVGGNLVLATSSGGSSWQPAPLEPSTQPEQISSIYFIDQETGWMASSTMSDEGGEIFITEQGGAYPVLQQSYEAPLTAIHFLDGNNGWAGGLDGKVVSTTNGGTEWVDLADLGTDLYDVHFTTASKGWVVGENGSLFKTIDGLNFNQEDLGINQRLNAVHFTDTLYGWVCGRRNTLFRRHLNSDNQVVWSNASITEASEASEWNDIYFINRLTGWLVGIEGNVWKTSDGGQNWERERIDTFEDLNAIFMISSNSGWIAADNGLIFAYTP